MSTSSPSSSPSTEGNADSEGALTLTQAVELAIQIHLSGVRTKTPQALEEAEQLYLRVLEAAPDQPDALHFYGVLLHHTQRSERGVELIRQALVLAPGNSDAHSNLGNVLKELGRGDEAAEAYRKAIELVPDHVNAHNNLGTVLKDGGKLEEAMAEYRRAITLAPNFANPHTNLGNVLQRLGRDDEAIREYREALAIDSRHPDARKLLGLALYNSGRLDEAVRLFKDWVRYEPTNPFAVHMLASTTGEDVPARASDAYVQNSFDLMSAGFDEHLRSLGYRAPELTYEAFAAEAPPASGQLDILDAGCGTGLCAPLFRPHARRLVGVDLSAGMLTRAYRLKLYDDLQQQELTAFLRRAPAVHDVVVSADTLCYFGDLDDVLGAGSLALRPGGWFVFTLEKAPEGSSPAGYRLNPHGRYSHEEGYVRAALVRAGLEARRVEQATLRMERLEPVEGLVIVAQRA